MPGQEGQSVCGETIPLFFKNLEGGYRLWIKVDEHTDVNLQPPGLVDDLVWPYTDRHLLDVVVQYCIAVLQFMTFAFPSDWDPRADWAGYTRDLIRGATPRLPSNTLQARNAFCVWAALTRSFFCGLNSAAGMNFTSPLDEEQNRATRWLHRLVGASGLKTIGPVYQAMSQWVLSMPPRLAKAYPQVMAASRAVAAAPGGTVAGPSTSGGSAAAAQEQVPRLLLTPHGQLTQVFRNEGGFYPIYPYHISGGFKENRLKINAGPTQDKDKDKGRRRPVIRGSGGVPPDDNCALAFMVASSVVQAFHQADKAALEKLPLGERLKVVDTMIEVVLKDDEIAEDVKHASWNYPTFLAASVTGWVLALEKIPLLVQAAEETFAAAGLVGVSGLLMPKQMALSNTEQCLRGLQMSPEALQQLLPVLPQALRDYANPALKAVGQEVGRLLEQNPLQPQIQSQQTPSQSVQPTRPPQQAPLPPPPPHPSLPPDGSLVGGQDQPRPRKRPRRATASPQALLAASGTAGAAPAGAGTSLGTEICGAAAGGSFAAVRRCLEPSCLPPSAAGGAVAIHGHCTFGNCVSVSAALPCMQMGQPLAAGAPAAGATFPQVVGMLLADTPSVAGGAGGPRYLPELAAPAAAQVLLSLQQHPGSAGGASLDMDWDVGGGGLSEEYEYLNFSSMSVEDMNVIFFRLAGIDLQSLFMIP